MYLSIITKRLQGLNFKYRRPDYYPIRNNLGLKFVFIHINKTAGTSIINALGVPKKRHLTVCEIIELVGKKCFDRAYSFSVVRNPWDKVASQYYHRIKTNQSELKIKPIEFNDWVLKVYGRNKDPKYYNPQYKMFYPQVDWLKDSTGKIVVDEILRFENLENDFNKISNKLGIKKKLPHKNKSQNNNYSIMYSKKSIDLIHEHFKEDINMFGYEFK